MTEKTTMDITKMDAEYEKIRKDVQAKQAEIEAMEKEIPRKVNAYRKRLQADLNLRKSACYDLQIKAARMEGQIMAARGAKKLAQPSPKARG